MSIGLGYPTKARGEISVAKDGVNELRPVMDKTPSTF
jgi:hypothetical protein